MHKELTSIRRALRAHQQVSSASLDVIKDDYRFNLVEENLSTAIEEFEGRLPTYNDLSNDALRQTEILIRRGLSNSGIEGEIGFAILRGMHGDIRFSLTESIFKDKSPLNHLTERAKELRDPLKVVYVGGKSEGRFSSEHRIHKISIDILKEVREDPLVQEHRRERKRLLKECDSLIESIEKMFVL